MAWESCYAVGLAIHISTEKNVCDVGSVGVYNDVLWWKNTKLKLRICFWANFTQILLSEECAEYEAEGDLQGCRRH